MFVIAGDGVMILIQHATSCQPQTFFKAEKIAGDGPQHNGGKDA